ncbi:MAG: UDP-N-acetylmuramoyl-L-alanine--D-glutamate ligase [Nitrospira sp.]|nr:UDP-N-acetylmuramoyl-L-alanine--D-glutamate ligase [Nitrospira sp.]
MINLKNKKVLVVGLGKSGIAASHLLLREGAIVTATDSRPFDLFPEGAKELINQNVKIETGIHNTESFLTSELIVLSPGVPADIPQIIKAREHGVRIIGEVELAYQLLNNTPLIAVTGSNGKSTTTTLIGEIIKTKGDSVFVGGNLGTPLSEYVLSGNKYSCIVAELSSFQLETIEEFRPFIAVLLNISPDHLDRYHSMKEYEDAKFRIFENQDKGNSAIINSDEPWSREITKIIKGNVVSCSRKSKVENGIYIDNGNMISSIESHSGKICEISHIGIKGVHNLENAMAAAAASLLWGCSPETVAHTLQEFKGLEHRLEFVREVDGVKYLNDSKGTNVGAVIKSLEGFSEPVLLIAGGRDKGSDFSPLRPLIKEKVKKLILIGEAGEKIKAALGDLTSTVFADSLEDAVQIARSVSVKGDAVLLSPACASFDMFKNFEDRGRIFKEIVRKITGGYDEPFKK